MDITKRKITKIAREVNKFTVRTLRAEGIGASEFDVIHAVRRIRALRKQRFAGSQDWIKGRSRVKRRAWRKKDILSARITRLTAAASFCMRRRKRRV